MAIRLDLMRGLGWVGQVLAALLVGVALVGCAGLPYPTCTQDASTFNTSGPGQTGGARICR